MKRINLLLCALGLSTLMGQAQLASLSLKNGVESANPGTNGNPYVINNLKDLDSFRQAVKTDGGANVCFELGASIDVSASDWVAMSTFKGELDGKGYAIQGLKAGTETEPMAMANVFGFFSNMDGATVSDLHFTSVAVYGDMSATAGHGYFGVLYGGSSQVNANYVLNCSVSGVINLKNEVTTGSSSLHAGGLIGQVLTGTKMVNCFGDVSIEVSSAQIANVGGLIGNIETKSNSDVVNCYTQGSVLAKGSLRTGENQRFFVGGVCGATATVGGRLLNSYSAAMVEGVSGSTGNNIPYVGGVAGGCVNASVFEVKNCLALGSSLKASQEGKTPILFRIVSYTDVVNEAGKLQVANNYANASMSLTRNGVELQPSKKGADQLDGADIDENFSPVKALNDYVKDNPTYEYKTGSTVRLLTWKAEDSKIVFGDVPSIVEEVFDATSMSFVVDGMVVFEGVDSNAAFQLSSLSGQLLASGMLADRSLRLPCKGIYIVRVNGQTYKVAY